jgi:radical SAM superfamily enzyme YgiQ (UPF0313 family)
MGDPPGRPYRKMTGIMKIVLANTVGIDNAGWSVIPYPSRWTTSSLGHEDAFTYYPRDLGYLSSLLKRDTPHSVKLVDACLKRLDRERYAELIISEKPDWLVIEDSSRTFGDDEWIARRVKEATGAKIVMTGQHASAFPAQALAFADVAVKGEYLKALRDFFRDGAEARGVLETDPRELVGVGELPFPEDDDVSRLDYAKKADPICEYTQIQIYASRGCPYSCAYCVARHTYYRSPMWRSRPVESVVAEMSALANKYPSLEGFFFDDEIHNANIKYTKELCRAIIAAGLNGMKLEAMLAYAPFDEEAITLMKQAGYYKVRVGIETADDHVAEMMSLKGKYRPEKLKWFLETAKKVGLKVYGTFTLGGTGSTADSDRKTIKLMSDLIRSGLLHDCQVSICTPQPGAPFYDWAVKEGVIDGQADFSKFDGGEEAVVSLPGYPAEEIKSARKAALAAYDEARSERDRVDFSSNWERSVGKLDFRPERVVVTRTSRAWHLDMALDAVKLEWNPQIAFLCHEGFIGDYSDKHPGLIHVPVREEGFLNWDTLSADNKAVLQNFNADLWIIPTATLYPRGYGNAARIAKMSGARKIVYLNREGEIIAIPAT